MTQSEVKEPLTAFNSESQPLAAGNQNPNQSAWDRTLAVYPDDPQALFGRGNALKDLGRLEEAIANYDRAVAIKPDFADAWNNRGVALLTLGRPEEAIACWDKALAIKQKDDILWNNRGVALKQLGRYEEAIACYDRALQIKPDYLDALGNRGNALISLKRYEEALACYDQVLKVKQDSHDAWNGKGNALSEGGRYQEAIACYERAITLKQNSHEAWYNRGNALTKLGREQYAIESYDRAIALKPNMAEAWENRGYVLNTLGRYQEAIDCYDRALAIKPESPLAWNNRGNSLKNLGRYSEAIGNYDKTLQLKPDKEDAWYNRGNALGSLGQYAEAIACYEKALQIKPDDYSAWNNRGYALKNLGRYQEAIASYERAVTIKKDFDAAWNNRGDALCELGRYEDAIANYERAIAIKPDYYNARNSLGWVLFNLGRYEEAIACYEKVLEANPDNLTAWHNKGYALYKLGRYEDAIACYDKVLEVEPNHQEVWTYRADALRGLGRYNEAISNYDQSLRHSENRYWQAWNNRGWTILESPQGYEAALQNWKQALQQLPSDAPDYARGCGEFYYSIGRAHYQHAQSTNSQNHWQQAKNNYRSALDFLTASKFRHRHLELLQDLVKVCHNLGETREAQAWVNEGIDQLRLLVQQTPSEVKKIELERQFAQFNQLRVDELAQVGEAVKALEKAEKQKNLSIHWISNGWSEDAPSPNYAEIQQLLNPQTAAIYWHVSPVAINTFILRHKEPPRILMQNAAPSFWQRLLGWVRRLLNAMLPGGRNKALNPSGGGYTGSSYSGSNPYGTQPTNGSNYGSTPEYENARGGAKSNRVEKGRGSGSGNGDTGYQLRQFEAWLKGWTRDYQDYRDRKPKKKANHPWRQQMSARLEELKDILGIPRILPQLSGVNQVILIPHRELHLLPLHYLFPRNLTITYLPSAQIGISLSVPQTVSSILNVQNPRPDLPFAIIESVALSALYPESQPLEIPALTKEQLLQALRENNDTFHFTGYGYHDIEHPKQSALVLAGTEKLTVGEILSSSNKVDFSKYNLICLWGGESGIASKQKTIDEYVGFATALLAKKATSVISSLWNVDELSSALLTIKFYQLLQTGKTPPAALKQAQDWLRELTYYNLAKWYREVGHIVGDRELKCRAYLDTAADLIEKDSDKMMGNQQPFADPYHWAGFTLSGRPSGE